MARARNIKPSFFINDTLAESNCPLGRLLFIGMWTIADCNGNFEWRPARIKAQVLPYDDCDIKKLAINLDKSGFIRFYSVGDKIFVNIPTFLDHQNPHKNEREKGGSVAEYSENGRQLIDLTTLTINRDKSGAKPEDSESDRADSPILNPDSCSLNEESLNGADAPDGDVPPPATPQKRKSKISDDFAPNDKHAAIAAEQGVSLAGEREKFVDHFAASGETKADWNRAFNNWLRRARSFGGAGKPSGETPQQRAERMARERGFA
jgi:hypothetical protein